MIHLLSFSTNSCVQSNPTCSCVAPRAQEHHSPYRVLGSRPDPPIKPARLRHLINRLWIQSPPEGRRAQGCIIRLPQPVSDRPPHLVPPRPLTLCMRRRLHGFGPVLLTELRNPDRVKLCWGYGMVFIDIERLC